MEDINVEEGAIRWWRNRSEVMEGEGTRKANIGRRRGTRRVREKKEGVRRARQRLEEEELQKRRSKYNM